MALQTPDSGRRRLLTAIPLVVTGLHLRSALADPAVQQVSRTLMGTRVAMTVHNTNGNDGQIAMSAAFAEMQRLSDLMSRYRTGNAVHALHLASGLQAITLEPEMFNVLQMAQAIATRSNGAFDITVGALTGWDFTQSQPVRPKAADIAQELTLVNYRDVVLNSKTSSAYLRHRGMRIDLGGIAKLPILQAGMQVLQRNGIQNAMINGGGDVLVHGQLQGRDWRVGLRDPRAPEHILGSIDLSEGFVAASGDYERFFLENGHRYHHILNPKTGQPTTGPHGVALVSRKLEDINGMGAAIMVAGAAAGRRLLQLSTGVDTLIAESGQGLWMSPGMSQRLHT